MDYPRPIRSVHQIEVTSHCNLRCVYCPSPKLEKIRGQAKQHMDMDVYTRALMWVQHFTEQGTQGELALTGIGEALLHPQFIALVAMARHAIGEKGKLTFSTNGLLLTDEICEQIKEYQPEVFVSLHRPEKAGPALNAARRHEIYAGMNTSFATSSFNWAGALDWEVTAPEITCSYLDLGRCVVLADGRITTCCLDAAGKGVVGHVDDEIGSLSIQPFESCEPCHMRVP